MTLERLWLAVQPARRWLDRRPNQVLLAAFVVGLVVRLVWVTLATRGGAPLTDAGEYLRTARDLADGHLPTFVSGEPSAFWAPGYPALLVPLVWFTDLTGWLSLEYAASLLNAVAASTTVLSTAYLTARWIDPRARNVAGWLMALAPAQVYWTSTQHAESVHTAMLLGVFAALTALVRHVPLGPRRTRLLVALGVVVGLAVLVRTPGTALFVLVLLVARAVDGSWRAAGRALAATVVGALVVLAPWAVRNGLQVGVWTPLSTQNATVVCVGHHEDATGGFEQDAFTDELREDCYRHSPYDDERLGLAPPGFEYAGPDEAEWYSSAMREGVGYALTHPAEEVELTIAKLREAYGSEWDALPGATNFSDLDWAGSATRPLHWVANAWLALVVAGALAGLALVPACRRAYPVWGLALTFTVMIMGGVAQPHYRHPAIPLLAALAAAALVAAARGPSAPAGPPGWGYEGEGTASSWSSSSSDGGLLASGDGSDGSDESDEPAEPSESPEADDRSRSAATAPAARTTTRGRTGWWYRPRAMPP